MRALSDPTAARISSAPRTAMGMAALVVATCLAAAPVAAAAQEPRLGLTPVGQPGAYFELTLVPGEERQFEAEAANFGGQSTLARTYAADVYSIVNGGFGAELYGEAPTDTTGWLSYPTQQFTLEPRQAVRVPLVVRVPLGTPPGDYITALVIENAGAVQGSGPLTLNQVIRSAIAVAIDVPGTRDPVVAIGAVGHKTVTGHSLVTFEVVNPGNVHLMPAGDFDVLDAEGSRIDAGTVAMDSVYAGTRTLLEAPLATPLPPGDYCAELSLTDAATGAHDETGCLAFSVPGLMPDPDGDSPLPSTLPKTSALVVAASVSVLVIAGGALLAAALVLIARRRTRKAGHGEAVGLRETRS